MSSRFVSTAVPVAFAAALVTACGSQPEVPDSMIPSVEADAGRSDEGAGGDGGLCAIPASCSATFTYPYGGEARVDLHGDFNQWGAGVPMPRQGNAWIASVPNLGDGQRIAYKFVVNGSTWVTDPANPVKAPDGVGGNNSVRIIRCGSCGASDGGSGAEDGSTTPNDASSIDGGGDGGVARICDVKQYGAKGDGKTNDTNALQAAIDACAGTGGTVYLRSGTFLSGMITLKSNLTFFIDSTAVLLGSQNDADYPDTNPPTANTQLKNCRKALVYAESASNLTIDGSGTINGNGNVPRWTGANALHTESKRPMPLYIALSNHVTIRNITIRDGAMWSLVNLETDYLTIQNVTIRSTLSGNRDGIDTVDCHHVTIEGCSIASEDDSICFKSGVRRGVDDVTVRSCHILQSSIANGLKFGTASYGSFKNVRFQDITIDWVDKAALAVESVDGADISNITFQRINVGTAGSPIFILLGDRGETPGNDVHKIGSVDSVSFTDVSIKTTRHAWGSPISGSIVNGQTYLLTNLSFTNVNTVVGGGRTSVPPDPPEYAGQYPDPNLWGDLPAFGYFLRHASGVNFTGSSTTAAKPDARKWLEPRDVTKLSIQ